MGGPSAQISLIHRQFVEKEKWVKPETFRNALNFCMLLPGPEAQQLSVYIGWVLFGRFGGLVSGLLFVLPSFFLTILVSYFYIKHGNLSQLEEIFFGARAAIIAIIVFTIWNIIRFFNFSFFWFFLSLITYLALSFGIPYPLIILISGCFGVIIYLLSFISKGLIESKLALRKTCTSKVFRESKLLVPSSKSVFIISLGIVIWGITFVLTYQFLGELVLSLYLFFSKASFISFGGAYAVLSYVFEFVVDGKLWLSTEEMANILSLGEILPGPLVMVNVITTFMVSYKYSDITNYIPEIGAATVVLIATFLPSFIFVLLGAPVYEKFMKIDLLKWFMKAISAAVIGILVHLAIRFSENVYLKGQVLSSLPLNIDLPSVALTIFAIFLLVRVNLSSFATLVCCSILGFFVQRYLNA